MNKGQAIPRNIVDFVQIQYPISQEDCNYLVKFLENTKSTIYPNAVQFRDFEGDMMNAYDGCYIIKQYHYDKEAYHLCDETEFIVDYNILD